MFHHLKFYPELFIYWRRKWQPTSVFLPGKSYGRRSVAGLQSLGLQRIRHDWVTSLIHFCCMLRVADLRRMKTCLSSVQSLSHVWLFVTPWTAAHPGSSVHGIFQARILEWVAISFCRRFSQPRDWMWVSLVASRCFTIWATRKSWDSEPQSNTGDWDPTSHLGQCWG